MRARLIALLALLLAAPALAQTRALVSPLSVEAGPSFPTGGDFNDVYKVGYHAGLSAERALGGNGGLRASVDYDLFGHDTIKPQYGEDNQWGRSFYTGVDAVLGRHSRLYVLGGLGYYQVHAAFLALDGHVIPAATQRSLGVDGGLGVHLGSGWRLEVRHHDAFRRQEGLARWIPLSLGHSL